MNKYLANNISNSSSTKGSSNTAGQAVIAKFLCMNTLSFPVVLILSYLLQQTCFWITLYYLICRLMFNIVLMRRDLPCIPMLPHECNLKNTSCLCHIVKRFDVLLSTSLFMNSKQCFSVLRSSFSARPSGSFHFSIPAHQITQPQFSSCPT